MDDQNKNLILATALSFVVILVWFLAFPPETPAPPQTVPPAAQTQVDAGGNTAASVPLAADSAGSGAAASAPVSNEIAAEADAPRIKIETPRLSGSISLAGGRIDDLLLTDYRVTLDKNSPTATKIFFAIASASSIPDALIHITQSSLIDVLPPGP